MKMIAKISHCERRKEMELYPTFVIANVIRIQTWNTQQNAQKRSIVDWD
jgi:hypothetical protein